jgi:hypothetical protein
MKTFVVMIDNEVVQNFELPEQGDDVSEEIIEPSMKQIAMFSSDPRIMEVDNVKEIGSIWDGQNFTAPVE